ncbi:MAG: hypothetical protein ACPG7N_00225 [Candidatus Thalassarchaeaceae archaeon]
MLIIAAGWTYLVTSYETDRGTSNVIGFEINSTNHDSQSNNELITLSIIEGEDDLEWSSLELSLSVDGENYPCSFGIHSQSNSEGLVVAKLGADGDTFTTEIDATDTNSFTHFDLPNQMLGNETNYWLKFSSTDIFLGDNISWTFLEGSEFSDVLDKPSKELSKNNGERLEWYTYDISVHRVNPNNGVYIFSTEEEFFKVKFLTYYNINDESRYPTMLISSLNGTTNPALSNSEIIAESPCLISTEYSNTTHWNFTETISLLENGINLCNLDCDIILKIRFEGLEVVAREIS